MDEHAAVRNGDEHATIALLGRLVRQAARRYPPPTGYGRWTPDAVLDLVADTFIRKGQGFVTRERKTWLTDQTYGEMWAEADMPGRSRLLRQALTQAIVVRPGKPHNSPTGRGKVPNVARAEIVWREEVNPE